MNPPIELDLLIWGGINQSRVYHAYEVLSMELGKWKTTGPCHPRNHVSSRECRPPLNKKPPDRGARAPRSASKLRGSTELTRLPALSPLTAPAPKRTGHGHGGWASAPRSMGLILRYPNPITVSSKALKREARRRGPDGARCAVGDSPGPALLARRASLARRPEAVWVGLSLPRKVREETRSHESWHGKYSNCRWKTV